MVECNSVERPNIYPNLNEIPLSDQQHFRLNKINEIKYYFIAEIKKKHNKIIMLARNKLNSIEGKVSEALINTEISHEDFMIIINEEKNYRELKESIRMITSQKIDAEKINLIEEGKVINNNLKYQI